MAPKPKESADTRRRVIDAAVASIIDEGFYQTSTNAVARKAGMTWGVLQHHFGSRERLLLAVLEDGWAELATVYADAVVTGETPVERLSSYFGVLNRFYGRPAYLAYVQIQLDLLHNPKVSAETAETMLKLRSDLAPMQTALLAQTSPGPNGRTIFHAMRGFIVSQLMESDALGIIRPNDHENYLSSADALIEALSHLVD